MRIALISFSTRGLELASRIAENLQASGDEVEVARGFGEDKVDHVLWTAEAFLSADALVFVGATGIAVRSIAPCLRHKTCDPAVVVIDERALHCIALLSGHIGGANPLASRIASYVGADPVITTATDVNRVFAVDSWAVTQDIRVVNPARIKTVSAKLLAGKRLRATSEFPVAGECPVGIDVTTPGVSESIDFSIGIHASGAGLRLAPRALILGVGCRRGTPVAVFSEAFSVLCEAHDLLPAAFGIVTSIDLKADEEGLIDFCRARGLRFVCHTAEELQALPGDFHSSEFVRKTTGTDNVCERAAMCSGAERLLVGREVRCGITIAVGIKPVLLSWA